MQYSWDKIKSGISYKTTICAVFLLALLSISILFGTSHYMKQISEATQERNMSHVTNLTCGIETPNETVVHTRCPGELECFHIREYEPGGDQQKTRCVEPEYLENFCGKYSQQMILQSFPPHLNCNPNYHVTDLIQSITQPVGEFIQN